MTSTHVHICYEIRTISVAARQLQGCCKTDSRRSNHLDMINILHHIMIAAAVRLSYDYLVVVKVVARQTHDDQTILTSWLDLFTAMLRSCGGCKVVAHSDHPAFFRRTLGTRLGSEHKPYWNYICGHVINKFSRRGSLICSKGGLRRKMRN